MPDIDPLNLVPILFCLLLLLDGAVVRRRLAAERRARAALVDRVATLERDLGALLSCSRAIGQRIGDVERTDRTLQKQIDKLRLNGDEGQVAVEHAMKLLASGHDMQAVTEICELTEGEVEILQNLSRYRPAA